MSRPPLTKEDQERLDCYLSSPVHQLERRSFRPWLLLLIILLVMTLLSGVSYVIAWHHGVI